MKFEVESINKYVLASDTDSIFIHVEPFLKKKHPDLNINDRTKMIPAVKSLAEKISEGLNIFQNKISKEIFNSNETLLSFKSELIIERAYFSGKRRYAQFIVDKEGVPVEELDIKGLDLMKSNFPPYFRDFTKQLIQDIMFGKPKEEIDKNIIKFRKSINTVDWRLLLKPTGLKQLEDYIDSPPKAGEIFSKLKLRCPINTRAAIVMNDLIRFKKLDKKYNTFRVGDKMFIAYLKDNPYKIDVIGFNGYDDPPFITELIENYIDKTKLFDSVLKNKLENLYNDLGWGAVIFNDNINKFFSFR